MFIVKRPIQKDYPNFNYMLTCSTVTYVNFKERCYVSHTPNNAIELDILRKNGFEPVDGAIADLVMRFNCVPGCSTKYCCAGHPGMYDHAYISFESIPDEYARRLDNSKYWFKDSDDLVWRNSTRFTDKTGKGVGKTDFTEWLHSLLELDKHIGLPENSFNICCMVYHTQKKDGVEECYIVLHNEYPSGMKERVKMHELIKNAPVGRTDYVE